MFNLDELVRPNIKAMVPYSSARDEFKGDAKVFLDANENSLGSPLTKWYNRYPDPMQLAIKEKLSVIKGIAPQHIFLGNGSDECIDILVRVFCEPALDNIIIVPPTYGMYEVSAHINNVNIRKVPLTTDFQLNLPALEEAIDEHTKMVFLCSPNNPTGNSLNPEDLNILLNNYFGIIVIDEAYINFSKQRSFIPELQEFPNLVILQTLSKAWGLAALRVGMAFASEPILSFMNKVKPPYNINQASQDLVLKALGHVDQVNEMIRTLVLERERMEELLPKLDCVVHVYPSDANFLLVKVTDARATYEKLLEFGIVVRDRSNVSLCSGCLRITIGTERENNELLRALAEFQPT